MNANGDLQTVTVSTVADGVILSFRRLSIGDENYEITKRYVRTALGGPEESDDPSGGFVKMKKIE